MTAFPDDWPQGCPPADAEPAAGLVYRLVKNAPVLATDFRTHAELGKLPKAPPCLRVGLSVFRSRDDAIHQAALLPFLGDKLASGELQPVHGRTKLTAGRMPSHTTWWPYPDIDRTGPFLTVEVLR